MTPLRCFFYHIQQYQEVQRIGKVPYSDEQIIANAIRVLPTSNIFPLKEFDTWETTITKTYPALKTFFQEAYGRSLTAIKLCTTAGQHGYTNNTIYNAFEAADDDTNDDTLNTAVLVPQMAAAATTTGSSLGTAPSAINAEIAAAISQLSANQSAIMSQMAAMSFVLANTLITCRASRTFNVPAPIQQLAIPLQQNFTPNVFNPGRHGGRGRGRGQGGRGGTPFADRMHTMGAILAMGTYASHAWGLALAPIPKWTTTARNPDFSNIYKRFNNWNICFLCGFNIEDEHTSLTCPFKKANHQMLFVHKNA